MKNQKELSKEYSYLNGCNIKLFLVRVPSPLKMAVYKYSLVPCGEHIEINPIIRKTHFNGKTLEIFVIQNMYGGVPNSVKVELKDFGKVRWSTKL